MVLFTTINGWNLPKNCLVRKENTADIHNVLSECEEEEEKQHAVSRNKGYWRSACQVKKQDSERQISHPFPLVESKFC